MDLQTELYEAEQTRLELVKRRDSIIDAANHMIDEANREFDGIAVVLGRTINELRERLKLDEKPAETKRERRRTVPLAGLDDDDQEHYRELLARKKKK